MSVPDTAEVSRLLDQLEHRIADDLESEVLDFKPWQGPKDDLKLACEYAACFANAGGGVVVFGVADTRLRQFSAGEGPYGQWNQRLESRILRNL